MTPSTRLILNKFLEKVEALKASIIAGEITVPSVPQTEVQGTTIQPSTSGDSDEAVTEPNVEGTVIPPTQ